jgi:hypothetical protein
MKRLSLGLFLGALVALAGCSSSPSTTLNGELSAHRRDTPATKDVAATRRPRRHATPTTRRLPPTTRTIPSVPIPTRPPITFPPTPTTISSSGVAGAVLYERDCGADHPCSFDGGQAKLTLRDASGNVVATGSTRDSGSFVLAAPPGQYTLIAKPPAKNRKCDSVPVTVEDGRYASARVVCHAA